MKKTLIRKAYDYAYNKHKGQKRKYSGNNYIVHPVRVAKLVNDIADGDIQMICAALLHDVIEDTDATYLEVSRKFGKEVSDMVLDLSNVRDDKEGKLNRAERKKRDRKRIAKVCEKSKTIKLADIVDNLKSIVKYDVKFRDVFFGEKAKMMEVLKDGNKDLYDKATKIIDRYYKGIGNEKRRKTK